MSNVALGMTDILRLESFNFVKVSTFTVSFVVTAAGQGNKFFEFICDSSRASDVSDNCWVFSLS